MRKKEQQAQKVGAIGCLSVVAIIVILYLIGSLRSTTPGKIEAWVMAQQFVKERLKSPGSADFGGVFSDYQDPDDVVSNLGAGKFRV